jgi:TolB-like protein/Tfp pilus assembly protein PilF
MKRCPACNRIENDDALTFCRADGTTLVSDSSSLGDDAGAARLGSAATEVDTSILPHTTNAGIGRHGADHSTACPAAIEHDARTNKIKAAVIALTLLFAAVAAAAIVISGYLYFSRKSSGAIESIAVLPFENRSGSPDTDYLSDGLAESLIYRLSQLPNLKVSPTSSVMRFKGKGGDLKTIANELGVSTVMTGRLVQRGENLTISVELIDVRNNKLLWGEQYERKMSELLATQREIATAITEKLQLKLSGDDAKGVTKKYTESNEAYQLYLKGRFYWNKRTVDGLRQAAEYYQHAIEKDPAFALAYSGLAETYGLFSNYSVAAPKDSMPQAKAAALKALELDDSLAEPHAALGLYLSAYAWDQSAAEKELRRAIELKPNYATTYHWLGNVLSFAKRPDEAIVAARRAEELDPLSAIISADTGFDLILARRYDEAIAQLDFCWTQIFTTPIICWGGPTMKKECISRRSRNVANLSN